MPRTSPRYLLHLSRNRAALAPALLLDTSERYHCFGNQIIQAYLAFFPPWCALHSAEQAWKLLAGKTPECL